MRTVCLGARAEDHSHMQAGASRTEMKATRADQARFTARHRLEFQDIHISSI